MNADRRLRVGVHPNNLFLRLAQAAMKLSADDSFDWVEYPDGRSTAGLMRAGAIDVGGTGSTPPLAAQAQGLDIVYIARSAPRPTNGALLVRRNGAIRAAADLAGKTVALVEGSFHTYLLALLAESARLSLSDVIRVDLAPSASAAALRAGSVDAWAAMDPLLAAERKASDLVILPGSEGLIANRSVFWTTRTAATTQPKQVAALMRQLDDVARIVRQMPKEASRWLAAAGDASQERWHAVLAERDWAVGPADKDFLGEQQVEADTLLRHGALPRPIILDEAAPPEMITREFA